MNTLKGDHNKEVNIPLAAVRKKTDISLVWVIPIVALFIATGLVYKAVTEHGPTVTIALKSAKGLESGKTKIKYKDVDVGQIEGIKVSDDLKGVVLTVRMVKEAESYLTDKTRFWVVRARLAAGNVSGLGTLLSGSYIAIDPGREGNSQHHFIGMEIPPVIMSDQPGRRFNLQAPDLGSLERGSPVYFKGIKVGQVMGYKLREQADFVDIHVFIEAPYDKNVVTSTRFWFSSGIDVDLNANGLQIDTQSFVSLMIGGLVFDNPDHIDTRLPVTDETILPIYDSPAEAMAVHYTEKIHYLLKFTHSVRGLTIGAPVEFRGFPVGKVVDISLETDWENARIKIPVKVELEPGRLRKLVDNRDITKNTIKTLIDMGMRAQLQTGNIITGNLFVALDLFEKAEPAFLVVHDDIVELPTIPSSLDALAGSLTSLLNKLEKFPMDEIGESTLKTIQGFSKTSASFKEIANGVQGLVTSDETKKALDNLDQSIKSIRKLTAELEKTLPSAVDTLSKETVSTMTGIQKVTDPDSALIFELKRTLKEFSKTAQSIRNLADLLERHPESLLKGKGMEK